MQKTNQFSELFDVSHTRASLQQRLSHARFRKALDDRLAQLDTPLPYACESTPGAELTSSTASHPRQRRRAPDSSKDQRVLQCEIAEAVNGIKEGLPVKPWHDTIRFVSFDLPNTAAEMKTWVETFARGDECSKDVVKQILARHPGMATHPETETYMNEIILPFRSFFIAQVIVSVLRLSPKKRTSDLKSSGGDAEHEQNAAALEAVVATERDKLPQYASHVHASHHALDLSDVRRIDEFLPDDVSGLRKHIAAMKKRDVCTRYAAYNLCYLESQDADSDELWIARMLPLANEGLAHAQFDVGMCMLSASKDNEGCAWLERAANNGHVSAMLQLGKFYLAHALGWDKGKGKAIAKGAKTSNRREEIRHCVKQALKWLDRVGDAELWDVRSLQEKSEAKQLISSAEAESKRMIDYEDAKDFLQKKEGTETRNRRILLAIVALLLLLGACLVAWNWYRGLLKNRSGVIETTEEFDDSLTHVPRNRAFDR